MTRGSCLRRSEWTRSVEPAKPCFVSSAGLIDKDRNIFLDSHFRTDITPSNATMAPVTTIPHKSNGHKRYLPEESTKSVELPSDVDLEESDADAGALQPVREPEETEWDGFDGAEEAQTDEDEESDADSVEIEIEKMKEKKPIAPKDAEEEELERIIFGDAAGFRHGIDDFSLSRTAGAYGDQSGAEDDDEDDDEGQADQPWFFVDAPVAAPAGSIPTATVDGSEDEGDKPAWDDSDDERLVVSLATMPGLKKLRETVEDDVINGKEYARRLRKQYERIYPTPDWAVHASGTVNRKRRRAMDDDESGEESTSDMDMDDEDLSSQPLARLLQDADILSRASRGPTKRRKLQAGTIDIQRLKAVSKAGPVSIPTSRAYAMTNTRLVCDHLAVFPPHLPYPALVRSQLDSIPASREPEPAEPEPASHVPPHQAHAAYDDRIPSVPFRLAHISERASTLLPHLEHCHRAGRENLAHLWPSTRATNHGVLLVVTRR
jgi:hypothetical protein